MGWRREYKKGKPLLKGETNNIQCLQRQVIYRIRMTKGNSGLYWQAACSGRLGDWSWHLVEGLVTPPPAHSNINRPGRLFIACLLPASCHKKIKRTRRKHSCPEVNVDPWVEYSQYTLGPLKQHRSYIKFRSGEHSLSISKTRRQKAEMNYILKRPYWNSRFKRGR